MKRTLCLFILLNLFTGSIALYAQEDQETQYLVPGKTEFSGFGAPIVEFSSLNGEFAVCLGGGGALLINQTFFFGGYGESILNNHYRDDVKIYVNIEHPKIAFEHGGFWLGYIYKHEKAIHGGLSMKLGWGEINLEGDEYIYNPALDYDFSDETFILTPQIEMEFNLTSWFKINLGAGYRFVTGIDATYLDSQSNEVNFYDKSDFNSPVGSVSLLFGGF